MLILRGVFGEKGRLAEILSEEDQNTIYEVIVRAEAANHFDPEHIYWSSTLTDKHDDFVWEWKHSKALLMIIYYSLFLQARLLATHTGIQVQNQRLHPRIV